MDNVLVLGGRVVATNTPQIPVTKAEYDAIDDSIKNDPKYTFYVTDYTDTDHQKVIELTSAIGSVDQLKGIADGTVLGAIKEIYDRLGGLYFAVDPENTYLQARENSENISNALQNLNADASDSEKIAYLESIMGNPDDLAATNYATAVAAIVDMYQRLNQLSFTVNDATGTVEVTDNLG